MQHAGGQIALAQHATRDVVPRHLLAVQRRVAVLDQVHLAAVDAGEHRLAQRLLVRQAHTRRSRHYSQPVVHLRPYGLVDAPLHVVREAPVSPQSQFVARRQHYFLGGLQQRRVHDRPQSRLQLRHVGLQHSDRVRRVVVRVQYTLRVVIIFHPLSRRATRRVAPHPLSSRYVSCQMR